MPNVSVLMPVFNTQEEYLRASIESILNQTYTDFEFLIADDFSDKYIEKIIKSYKDERIKYFRNEKNLGIAKTRNKLMELAKGEYFALMDHDDISLADRFLKQVDFLEKNPDISIVSSSIETFPEKQIIRHPKRIKFFDLLSGCKIANPAAMIRNEDLKKAQILYRDEYKCCQDYDFWSRAILSMNIANIDEVLLLHRINKGSLTHRYYEETKQDTIEIKNNMLDFLTSDKKLQDKINCLVFEYFGKKNSFLENIFSIRNYMNYKIITLLGMKIIRNKQ